MIPQLDLSFEVTNWMRLSVGAMGVGNRTAGYVGVRFILFGAGGSKSQ